jgi:hypothetical protein
MSNVLIAKTRRRYTVDSLMLDRRMDMIIVRDAMKEMHPVTIGVMTSAINSDLD